MLKGNLLYLLQVPLSLGLKALITVFFPSFSNLLC